MLYLADSLKFDYKLLKYVDYIFTSPPFYKWGGTIFGNSPTQHAQRMMAWFHSLLEKTGANLALVHIEKGHFARVNSKGFKPFPFVSTMLADENKHWQTLAEQDIWSLISRYFNVTKDKTMLDPFCGTGRFLQIAQKAGMNIIGIDFDEEQLKIASLKLEIPITKKESQHEADLSIP